MKPTTNWFDEMREGDAYPEWTVPHLTRTDFVRFAGASGDFNPIHHDDTFAARAGYPTVFGHGMFTAGLLSHYITDWLGIETVRRLAYRFERQVWPGDSLTFSGHITERLAADGNQVVCCHFVVVNQNGETVLQAEVTAHV